MPLRISEALNIDSKILKKYGVLNSFADIDSLFYIDPFLLDTTDISEFQSSRQKFEVYFKNVLKLVETSSSQGDRFSREAFKRLQFKELQFIGLGYSSKSQSGSAIGPKLARILLNTTKEIIAAGIKDPSIFELVGLFEEGIGPDRISDMTADIIIEDILKYNHRLVGELKISSKTNITFNQHEYTVPLNPIRRKILLLMPSKILSPLPIAFNWSDIDFVCSQNEEVRNRVNKIIGNTWKQATNQNRISKNELKKILLKEPELIHNLLHLYNKKSKDGYDFAKDPAGELIWDDIAKEYSKAFPLNFSNKTISKKEDLLKIIIQICEQYKTLIEDNGLNKLLYDDDKKPRKEKFAQLLFYALSICYCQSNNIDITPESNSGRGPVDFKFSKGFYAKVNVEIKYSSNPQLLHGYRKQLPAYNKAEQTDVSIFFVIRNTSSENKIKQLRKIEENEKKQKLCVPILFIADATYKLSASKLR